MIPSLPVMLLSGAILLEVILIASLLILLAHGKITTKKAKWIAVLFAVLCVSLALTLPYRSEGLLYGPAFAGFLLGGTILAFMEN